VTVCAQVEHFGGYYVYEHRWMDLSVLVCYIVCLRIGTYLTLTFVRHINR
jgi:hypothetical protein